MSKEVAFRVSGLNVEYPGERIKIENIDFAICQEQVLGIAGESGSGKSTICKAILGLLDSRASKVQGKIYLGRTEITSLENRRVINGKDIGYVGQNPAMAFDPCMRIIGHFTETLMTHLSCSKKDARFYAQEMLIKVGLKEPERVLKSYAYQLSGGMLQRVMIAIAISMNPLLLVADEPTSALDLGSRDVITELIKNIVHKYGPAMLIVSHEMDVLGEIADELLIMKDGRIVEKGSTEDIFLNPQNEHTKELIHAATLY